MAEPTIADVSDEFDKVEYLTRALAKYQSDYDTPGQSPAQRDATILAIVAYRSALDAATAAGA